ncbi:hypothetical protein [Desulfofundulus thermobenzoicus]|nr:hypothetical protein [Desulfofundulus thermobenzoicus]
MSYGKETNGRPVRVGGDSGGILRREKHRLLYSIILYVQQV